MTLLASDTILLYCLYEVSRKLFILLDKYKLANCWQASSPIPYNGAHTLNGLYVQITFSLSDKTYQRKELSEVFSFNTAC